MIPVSVKFVTDEMEKKVAEINDSINRLKKSYSWKWGSVPLEQEKKYIKKDRWVEAHHLLLLFGRYYCKSQNPLCKECKLKKYCNKK